MARMERREKGCSWLQSGGLSLGKCRDIMRQRWGSGAGLGALCLSLSLSVSGIRGEMVVALVLGCCCEENSLPLQSFGLHCFSLPRLGLCSQERPLNWDLFHTGSHWEGPSPSAWVPQGKPSTPNSSSWREHPPRLVGGQLSLPSPLFSAAAEAFLLHFNSHVHPTPCDRARASEILLHFVATQVCSPLQFQLATPRFLLQHPEWN